MIVSSDQDVTFQTKKKTGMNYNSRKLNVVQQEQDDEKKAFDKMKMLRSSMAEKNERISLSLKEILTIVFTIVSRT